MENTNLLLPLITAVFIAAAGGLLGSFAILKRMALAGDALSHVALPGLALALLLKINPFIGALGFLLLATFGIWILEYKSKVSVETLIGIFFTTSLALGTLFIPNLELIEALFGDISNLALNEAIFSILLSLILIILVFLVHKKMALNMLSHELAHSIGINSKRMELAFLLLFALGVALGIKFVGALLMGALIIIPAAAAKNVAKGLHGFMALSMIFGMAAAALGTYISFAFKLEPGPIFILISTMLFVLSFLWKKLTK